MWPLQPTHPHEKEKGKVGVRGAVTESNLTPQWSDSSPDSLQGLLGHIVFVPGGNISANTQDSKRVTRFGDLES